MLKGKRGRERERERERIKNNQKMVAECFSQDGDIGAPEFTFPPGHIKSTDTHRTIPSEN